MVEGRIEVTGRRGRRRKYLLNDLREKGGYWKLRGSNRGHTVEKFAMDLVSFSFKIKLRKYVVKRNFSVFLLLLLLLLLLLVGSRRLTPPECTATLRLTLLWNFPLAPPGAPTSTTT
jgi:hypothetical protein